MSDPARKALRLVARELELQGEALSRTITTTLANAKALQETQRSLQLHSSSISDLRDAIDQLTSPAE